MGLALPPFLMGGANGIKGHNANIDSSSESEDWAEEAWTVDCPCGVNFDDGEEMVQCDECEVWVHTACCQVIKSVDIYVCDKCKEKKRKEHEESEVAQLLVELPGKSVSFDDRSNDLLLAGGQTSYAHEVAIERRAHEHGAPGGDASLFAGSGVFSQQLWKSTGYVPKFLQVQYCEFPEWGSDTQGLAGSMFDACKQPAKDLAKGLKKVKQDVSNAEDRLRLPAPGKKLELNRPGKQKHKFQKLKEPQQTYSKRSREELKEHYSRKKPKTSPEVVRVENPKKTSSQQSPKNPKAMKKSAVQEFMDVDTRVCSKCLKAETVSNDDQGNLSKPLVCQECLKSRQGVSTSKKPTDMEGASKLRVSDNGATTSQNLSSETASIELPVKQSSDLVEPLEKKPHEGESTESHQSSMQQQQQQQQQKPVLMKPPDDIHVFQRRSNTETSTELKAQLTVKTSSFSKTEIPSPASINSGGPSGASVRTSPSSPTNQKQALKPPGKLGLKPVAPGKPSSSKPSTPAPASAAAAVPTFKKSEAKSSSGAAPGVKANSSPQPAALKPCKSSGPHTGVKHGQLLRKPGLAKSGASSKDGGERSRDERSSISRSSPPGSATAAVAAALPLNDEELALLLHQELNSSPRVPRVPRVRQAAAAISAQPSIILTKRALGGGASASQKEHRLMWRKRHRDDLKESSRKQAEASSHSSKRHEEGSKSEDEGSSSGGESSEPSEGANEDDPKKHQASDVHL